MKLNQLTFFQDKGTVNNYKLYFFIYSIIINRPQTLFAVFNVEVYALDHKQKTYHPKGWINNTY